MIGSTCALFRLGEFGKKAAIHVSYVGPLSSKNVPPIDIYASKDDEPGFHDFDTGYHLPCRSFSCTEMRIQKHAIHQRRL